MPHQPHPNPKQSEIEKETHKRTIRMTLTHWESRFTHSLTTFKCCNVFQLVDPLNLVRRTLRFQQDSTMCCTSNEKVL